MAQTVITTKINGAVAASHTGTGTTILYTAPSNGYAFVQINAVVFTTSLNVNVAGQRVRTFTAAGQDIQGVYVGPSQALTMVAGAAGNEVDVSGVEFVNG